jgi:glutathione S-transferase
MGIVHAPPRLGLKDPRTSDHIQVQTSNPDLFMKLYAHPGASSMHIHILLREIGRPFDLEMVNVTKKLRADGSDYFEINPRGLVPVLEFEDGSRLTENVVIAQYLCDQAGRTDLMPAAGSLERYRVMEWQSYVATEFHKGFSPLYWPVDDTVKAMVRTTLLRRFQLLSERLGDRPYLTGEVFTAADSYLFVIASWAYFFAFDLSPFPNVEAYLARIGARPSVAAALAAEGPGLVSVRAAGAQGTTA